MITIRNYEPEDRLIWDTIVDTATKSHFLFRRSFMEYHEDRFQDASLIICQNDKPVAVFPANLNKNELYSHQGLTFGGMVVSESFQTTKNVLEAFDALIIYLRQKNIRSLTYKALPYIYSQRPAEEDIYALARHGAILIRNEVTTSILLSCPGRVSSQRIRGIKKAAKHDITFQESNDWSGYWDILSERLKQRHGANPVHTTEEIKSLAAQHPDNIRLFTALSIAGEMLAGVVIFETVTVAHAQYIAGTDKGFEAGALDGLFDFLIKSYTPLKTYFDFGISTEESGTILNSGLIAQKEGFGGSAVAHKVYHIAL